MKVQRHFLFMVALGLALCLATAPASAEDFFVVAGGGTSGKVLKTQVFTSHTTNDTLGTSNWEKLDSPQWTYTKLSATSYLVITYQDCIHGTGGWSYYQLRVNDQPSVAGAWGALLATPSFNIYGTTGVWLGSPKGDVNLSIWHTQSGCTDCAQNYGGFTTNVTVMEIEH
jgi:hypothetical protein